MIVAAGLPGALADAAGVGGADVAHVRDEVELAALLAAPRDWQAVLLGPALAQPVDVARRVRATLPDVAILLLAERGAAARLQHELLLAPIGGEPVRCVPLDEAAPKVLERHLRQAFLRRRHTLALQSANRAVGAAPSPAARLPPAMEQLIEATPVPILVADRGGRIVHRNRAARALRPGRATTLAEALAGAAIPDVGALTRREGAGPLRRVPWDGRAFDVIASPLVLPPAIDVVLVILDDVTELVRSEEARRREADVHATILDVQNDLGEGVVLLENERIAYANDAIARMVGRPRESLLGADPYQLLAERERGRLRDLHRRRRAGDPDVPDLYESVCLRADGAEFPVEVGARVVAPGGAAVIVVRDISRRLQMQEEVEKARAGLAQMDKLATVGSLVSGLAHEIRTPLAAIVNEAHLIERQVQRALAAPDAKPELAEVPERVQALDAAVDRIRRLMKDMQSFMRGERPHKERLPLARPVEDAVRFFAATQRGNVTVTSRITAQGVVDADAAQVQQIVINLLQNAAEASASGAEVLVEARDEPDAVVLAVVDQGAGIDPDLQARMFDAFVTTKPRGSGLGLAIVRRLSEIHGARIRVESAPGRGTRMEIAFPRAAP